MIRTANILSLFNGLKSVQIKRTLSVYVSEEIKNALEQKQPVVALESTIITHGMPFPDNVNCALEVEDIVRQQGAIPATIAIIQGKIQIGLSQEEINILADTKACNPIKTSRRDLSYVVGSKRNGGTTVSSTIIAATKAGIPIFATGGIGGVHRGAESTFDISADLTELGRSQIAVVSSGVKSILDIPKTLEYLETQGVFVATLEKLKIFPRSTQSKVAAQYPIAYSQQKKRPQSLTARTRLGLHSGMLFAVPIPEEHAIDFDTIESFIQKALRDATNRGIKGKDITPFLLSQIAELTGGRSLESNVALIKNNARVAADIAVALAKLRTGSVQNGGDTTHIRLEGRPIVIGGSNLDCSATVETSEIKVSFLQFYMKECEHCTKVTALPASTFYLINITYTFTSW
ncbi:hypothetical protein JTB14_033066 [Gonioctena quinquepunctata]|nr:hypothetical protein JTB14_033066 [Gonioctena quinquepunctata]